MGERRVRITAKVTEKDYTERFRSVPTDQRHARTLKDYIDEFGGLEGEVKDPFGSTRRVSLAAFDGVAPDSYLRLQFVVAPDGEDFAPLFDDALVLAEYTLPEGTKLPGV